MTIKSRNTAAHGLDILQFQLHNLFATLYMKKRSLVEFSPTPE